MTCAEQTEQPDGSWTAMRFGVRLFLDATDNTEANAVLRRARRNEPEITHLLRAVTDHLRTTTPTVRLAGPETGEQLKSELSVKTKFHLKRHAAPNDAAADVADRIRDAVRYAIVTPDADYSRVVRQAYTCLADRFSDITVKNAWDNTGYCGINSSWRDSRTGQKFEVQFHTRDSFDAEHDSHDLHVRERLNRAVGVPDPEVTRVLAERYRRVRVPPGAQRLRFPVSSAPRR